MTPVKMNTFDNLEELQISFDRNKLNTTLDKSEKVQMLITAFLRFHLTPLSTVHTSLNEIVSSCGYSTKSNNKENNSFFKEVLKDMVAKKIIYTDNIDGLKNSQLFVIHCINKSIFYHNKFFVLLNYNEFNSIVNAPSTVSKANLLHGYLLVKQYIYHQMSDDVPKISYPSKQELTKRLGYSSDTSTETLLKNLVSSGLLHVKTGMYIKKDGVVIPTRNVYALNKSELKHADTVLKEFYQVDKIYTKKNKTSITT